MRILAVADIHGTEDAIRVVNEQIKKYSPDLFIVCGDLTHSSPPDWAKEFLNNIPIKSLVIPGNWDPENVISSMKESNAIYLHKRNLMINEYTFVGFGGSNPTPFNTPLEFSEEEIYNGLKDIITKGAILVVHAPAKGYLDRTPTTNNLGSESLTMIISEFSPILVISAHIHESRGFERDGKTTFVNPGPASKGYAAVIDLNAVIEVELIEG